MSGEYERGAAALDYLTERTYMMGDIKAEVTRLRRIEKWAIKQQPIQVGDNVVFNDVVGGKAVDVEGVVSELYYVEAWPALGDHAKEDRWLCIVDTPIDKPTERHARNVKALKRVEIECTCPMHLHAIKCTCKCYVCEAER